MPPFQTVPAMAQGVDWAFEIPIRRGLDSLCEWCLCNRWHDLIWPLYAQGSEMAPDCRFDFIASFFGVGDHRLYLFH